MADFKTTLEALTRGEIKFDSVASNIDKLLQRKPQAAVKIMDQLKEAYTADVIDAETYAKLRARVAGLVESAELAGDRGADEATQFTGDATQILDDSTQSAEAPSESTEFLDLTTGETSAAASMQTSASTGIDFDLTGESGPSTGSSWPDTDSQTGQTGTDLAQPAASAAGSTLGPNSVLRERFILDEVLGVGGMGSVWLGRDLIKVQAQDRQPKIALKS